MDSSVLFVPSLVLTLAFLVVQQMTRLPKDTRFGLMMAACLGRKFNSTVLCKALKGDASNSFVQTCIDSGGSHHATRKNFDFLVSSLT